MNSNVADWQICTQCFKWPTSLSLSVRFVNYSSYIGLYRVQTRSLHWVLNRINYDVARHLKTVWEVTYQSLLTVRYLDPESLPQDVKRLKPSRGWIGLCLTKRFTWARTIGIVSDGSLSRNSLQWRNIRFLFRLLSRLISWLLSILQLQLKSCACMQHV